MPYEQMVGKMSSKDYLKCALFSLMEKKSIHKITVKELCDCAMINRSTFYSNYDSLDSFFNSVMVELASGLVAAIETEGAPENMLHNKSIAYRRYLKWYTHVHKNANAFRLFLGVNGTTVFRDLLLKQGLDWYMNFLSSIMPRYSDRVSIDILVHYLINAHMGLLEFYLGNGKKYSPEYMAEQMVNITMAGPYSLLKLFDE